MIAVHAGSSKDTAIYGRQQYLAVGSRMSVPMTPNEVDVQYLAPRVGTIRKGKILILAHYGVEFTVNIRVNGVAVLTKTVAAGAPDGTVHDIPGQAVFAFSPAGVAHISAELTCAADVPPSNFQITVSYDIGR